MKMIILTMKKSNNPLLNLELLYADDSCIAVHKHPGIPCQTRSKNPPYPLDLSLQQFLNEPIRIWTRIDQPVSGIVLFYRCEINGSTQKISIIDKQYLGIVEGHPESVEDQQTIVSHIRRDGRKMKAIEDKENGKRAELKFTVLKKFDHYTLLKIAPATGRFHQIRQQLAHIGHPVKGDVKYGARRKNADRSIHLHAMEYVIQQKDREPPSICDYSFPDDPLWSLTHPWIDQEKYFQKSK